MSALHFLMQTKNRVVGVVHINHNTEHAPRAEELVTAFCKQHGLPLIRRQIEGEPGKGVSLENFWRNHRHDAFRKVAWERKGPVIVLAHNFDECVEEYLMCTLVRGYRGTIPYRNGPCIRPFRLWKRVDIKNYVRRNKIPWIEDPSNHDHKFKRVWIRHKLMPHVRELNPGIYKIVRKVIEEQDLREEEQEMKKLSKDPNTIIGEWS